MKFLLPLQLLSQVFASGDLSLQQVDVELYNDLNCGCYGMSVQLCQDNICTQWGTAKSTDRGTKPSWGPADFPGKMLKFNKDDPIKVNLRGDDKFCPGFVYITLKGHVTYSVGVGGFDTSFTAVAQPPKKEADGSN